MLSDQELQDTQRAWENCSSKKIKRKLKKKLDEHNYAIKYPPFSPLPHHQHFFNRKTDERIIHKVIDNAKTSNVILLDTESITVHRQPNRPGLIQIQLTPADELPVVIIIEVNHLPSTDSNKFELMKKFFRIVLDPERTIYTWGKIDELKAFVEFNLFDERQINQSDNEDLQNIFKQHWQQHHKHKATVDCTCEKCIGKKPKDTWKLLDAVAYQLHEWLDKRHTCSPFNIGLDPKLYQLSIEELEYRKTLSQYAANDVLSMEKLMISMQDESPVMESMVEHMAQAPQIQNESPPDPTEGAILLIHQPSPPPIQQIDQQRSEQINHQQAQEEEQNEQSNESNQIRYRSEENPQHQRGNNHINISEQQHRVEHQHEYNQEERKRRNRIRTVKQRQRNFKYEIIRRGIDPRFSITIVKEILRRYGISYTALQISKSQWTRRTSLYIGIRDPAKLREYEHRTRPLFTTEFYDEFRARNRFRRR
jgi:hypothetical protein